MGLKISINNTCENCLSCSSVCEENAIIHETQKSFIDEAQCTNCELCIHICPSNAIHLIKSPSVELDLP